jgi:hypothetical protein
MVAEKTAVICPKCSGLDCQKLVSRFQRYRNEDDRVDAMADRLESMDEPESGAEMREILKELGRATDDDNSAEMEEIFEADMEGKLEDDF